MKKTKSNVEICVLYPDLLGTYGDGGNATVLAKRLEWRDIASTLVETTMGEEVPDSCDIYLLGGGEDQPQTAVTDHLMASRSLHRAVDKGAVVLAVCAGMQVLGESFAVARDRMRDGLGLLDLQTVRGQGARRVGEVTVQPTARLGADPLTGYENHGGVTRLGVDVEPMGTVLSGKGNDDGLGSEGALKGKVVGTYLHGPVLARNPQFADVLLQWATGSELKPLDDVEVDALRGERFNAALRRDSAVSLFEDAKAFIRRR